MLRVIKKNAQFLNFCYAYYYIVSYINFAVVSAYFMLQKMIVQFELTTLGMIGDTLGFPITDCVIMQ